MKVRIFSEHGSDCAEKLEVAVNDWIKSQSSVEVLSITPSMCTVGGEALGEFWQFMTITVVYDDD